MPGFFFGLVKCANWWMFNFLEEEERGVITDIYEVCVILKLLVTTITSLSLSLSLYLSIFLSFFTGGFVRVEDDVHN